MILRDIKFGSIVGTFRFYVWNKYPFIYWFRLNGDRGFIENVKLTIKTWRNKHGI